MLNPRTEDLLKEYGYLTEHVSMWDVAVERQIQVKGPDAAAFVDMLITRDVHTAVPTMQARYVILCNQYGGVINDPVLLRVADDEFWFSISDSDLLLWAQGVNVSGRFDVDIHEIDVSPVQIQGPQVGATDGENVRTACQGHSVLRPDSRHAERTRRHDLAHGLLRRGRIRDLPSRGYAAMPTMYGRTSWNKARSSTCV